MGFDTELTHDRGASFPLQSYVPKTEVFDTIGGCPALLDVCPRGWSAHQKAGDPVRATWRDAAKAAIDVGQAGGSRR